MTRLDPAGSEKLLTKVLWRLPKLTDAACAGRSELFDARDPDEDAESAEYRHHRAAALCRTCPVLDACSEYADTDNSKARHVIAGRIPSPPATAGRPRKETSA